MSPLVIALFVIGYFLLLLLIAHFTSGKGDNAAFFIGNKKSPWYVVAFGMIGASLSGVTFISVPGWVEASQFSYMQMVLGYLAGYFVIAYVLMPLYYKLNLISIYGYLEQRFGFWSYKTGAFCFLASRVIGAAFRLYLVALVFQLAVFDQLNVNVPFVVTVCITIVLIWLYTFKGGIKTIIWTDTLQTLFMLLAVGVTVALISDKMGWGIGEMVTAVSESKYSKMFFFENWKDSKHFAKQFMSGAFIAIVMTGLDQDMMQKNLSCKNLKDAQKNMVSFSLVLVIVNLLFLVLGALLFMFADSTGILVPEKADELFPLIATGGYLGPVVAVFFVLGLVAAAYSSADSALTALTTSVCVDFLNIERKEERQKIRTRKWVHLFISVLLVLVIMLFKLINDDSVIKELFIAAGYTYGPLLGLFAFGILTNRQLKDPMVPIICVLSPLICYFLKTNSEWLLNGYKFGFELLIYNGLITFLGLFIVSIRGNQNELKV